MLYLEIVNCLVGILIIVIAVKFCCVKLGPIEISSIGFSFLLCLIVNGYLIDPSYASDQFGYFDSALSCRNFNGVDLLTTVGFGGFFYCIIPIPFYVSLTSLSIANATFFALFYVLLIKHLKSDRLIRFTIVLFPSLFFYRSIVLRDIFVLALTIWLFATIYSRKYFLGLVLVAVLSIIKIQNVLFAIVYFFAGYFFELKPIKKATLILVVLGIVFYYNTIFLEEYNRYALNFYAESGEPVNDYVFVNSITSFFFGFPTYVANFFSPYLFTSTNTFQLLQSIENLILICFLLVYLVRVYRLSKKNFFQLIVFLILCILFYGSTVLNAGTLSRYRTFVFVLFFVLNSNFFIPRRDIRL